MATVVGAALAWDDTCTDRPFTMVTVMGAPLPDMRASVGYPFAVQVLGPALVTVMVPVIVPAAPWDWPPAAVTLAQVVVLAAADVVVDDGGVVVDVVVVVVTALWCDVVVVVDGVFELLQAAARRATPANEASAQ